MEIVIFEGKEIGNIRIDLHRRQWAGRSGQLLLRLFEMIGIEMGIAESVDEFPRLETCHLRHHHRQQRVGGNVKRHAEEDVRRALVHLAGELAIGHVELEQAVAGGSAISSTNAGFHAETIKRLE